MKKTLAVLVMVLLLSPIVAVAQAQPAPDAKQFTDNFDSYIRTVMERIPDIPGMAVVVIKDDKPVFLKAYGMADREAGLKADADTMWYIASSTKSFTALAAAMLDKEGKIKLSDPVTKYTNGVTFKNQIPDKITVRDLLTHTSGLRNGTLVNRLAFTGQIEPDDIDRVFADATMFDEAKYGKYAYTNLGYNIYGLLLQRTLNRKWQDVLHERVFDPAGLKLTTAYISRARAKKWNVAAPYYLDHVQGKVVRSLLEKKDDNMQSAGGMFMSISDLGKWLNLNMNEGRLNGKQVFPVELIRAAHTGYTQSTRNEPPFSGDGEYGLGWQIGKYGNEKVIYHHGGFAGYRSHVSFMPGRKIGVGVLVNNDFVGGRMADVVATYAYDWWLRTENLETNYAKQLQETIDTYERRKQQAHGAAMERAKRTWQLTKPFADYAGKYTNVLLGTIEIAPASNALAVRMGRMNTIATPFTEKETIRVEMIPGGNGEVIRFNLDANGSIRSLNYGGADFDRVP
jgi:CubicO group peptidase (beta-lactamase class C family)